MTHRLCRLAREEKTSAWAIGFRDIGLTSLPGFGSSVSCIGLGARSLRHKKKHDAESAPETKGSWHLVTMVMKKVTILVIACNSLITVHIVP